MTHNGHHREAHTERRGDRHDDRRDDRRETERAAEMAGRYDQAHAATRSDQERPDKFFSPQVGVPTRNDQDAEIDDDCRCLAMTGRGITQRMNVVGTGDEQSEAVIHASKRPGTANPSHDLALGLAFKLFIKNQGENSKLKCFV